MSDKKKTEKKLTEVQVERRKAIKDFLKSLIFPIVVCLIIVGLLVVAKKVTDSKNAEEESILPEFYTGEETELVLENDKLKFVLDPVTTQFTVEKKSTGKIWYSNPQDADTDAIALTAEKGRLKSTVIMEYATDIDNKEKYDSYTYSVKNQVYTIEQKDDCIRVNYNLGKIERTYDIPPVITDSRLQGFLDNMEAKAKEKVTSYYKKYDINKLKKNDDPEELKAKYPIIEQEVIWVPRDNMKKELKISLEKYFASAGYTHEDYEQDSLLVAGTEIVDVPIFKLSMEYRLDGDDLLVSIPYDSLECLKKYNFYNITLLPYLGAGNKTSDGFIIVPEGGGSIINFNNGKTKQSDYYSNMYGWDMCISRDDMVHTTETTFNCYGISDKENSFIRILEDGAPYAAIQASVSGKSNTFNYANTVYNVTQREQFDVGSISSTDIYKYISELPDERISERISFIDSGDYVDMAKDYREYLFNKYPGEFEKKTDTAAPVSVEVVGAVDKKVQVLGIPVRRPLALTSFDEASAMINKLYEAGFKNMAVKYTGWCNGGVNQQVLSSISPLSQLGGKSDLKDLIANVKKLEGVDLYLNGITQYAYDSDIFDGFFSFTDAARFISKERAELYVYSGVTYSAREGVDSYYLLHTDLGTKYADKLNDYCKDMGVNTSFEDIGSDLSSDFDEDKMTTRMDAMKLHQQLMKKYSDQGQKLMVNKGNDYALPYADIVTNMDLKGSEYTIIDNTVPFLQLALHGYVDYTGKPLNICGNTEDELLASAEYGAGLAFTFMDEDTFTLQNTIYMMYYGSDFSVWGDRATEIYTRYNNELGHIFNQEMTGFENLSNEVSLTEYADGTKVYVNFSYSDFTAPDGTKVPARDYKVVR